MRMPIVILLTALAASPAAAGCTTERGFTTCVSPEGLYSNTPPQGDRRTGSAQTTADDDDYGTPTYYSDGTYGYSMGDGQQWRERYKGDRQGVTGYNYR